MSIDNSPLSASLFINPAFSAFPRLMITTSCQLPWISISEMYTRKFAREGAGLALYGAQVSKGVKVRKRNHFHHRLI